MTSKSEQRRLAQQGQGRLCCVCSKPLTVDDAIVWVISGLPVKYLCCGEHLAEAKARASSDPTLKVSPP